MGIPVYFKTLISDYGDNILHKDKYDDINYLFFDLNCLIHPCCQKLTDEQEMFDNIHTNMIKIINITIIVGPLFDNLFQLNKIIKSYKNIKLIKSSNEIWKDLSKADVAITNGGNTLFESCALSIPTLSIPAFKHEVKYSEAFMKENFCVNLGLKQINPEKINSNLLNLLENTSLRKKMFYSGKKIVDGKGLLRVQKIILNSLI